MTKRTITALMSIAMLIFQFSCTQAAPEILSTDNPEQLNNSTPPDNPTQPNNPTQPDDPNPSQPTTPSSSSSRPNTTQSSSSRANTTVSSNSNTSNGGVECNKYCKWDTGCAIISIDPTGEYGTVITTCAAAIANCELFSPSKQAYSNSTCSGGTTTPSTGVSVECDGYCKWDDTGCVRISTDPTGRYGIETRTCDAAILICQLYGQLCY